MTPPSTEGCRRWALFLDLDGTLVELAPTPDSVRVDPELPALLARLEHELDGALAVISGRSLDDLDAMLAPLRLAAAGLHGLERRASNGAAPADGARSPALARVRGRLERFVAARPGLLLEDKGEALALHFRRAPEREAECRHQASVVLEELADYQLLAGKMVVEIKPRAANKAAALEAFAGEAPFRGRRPVFAGDDRTDEDGFRWVNAEGGISIKVGEGPSAARYHLASVAALHAWLRTVEAALGRATPPVSTT